MKKILLIVLLIISFNIVSNAQLKNRKIIVITTDGFRWQEIFKGLDVEILKNKFYQNGDSVNTVKNFGSISAEESRKKIMPFLWSVVATNGQIHGKREHESLVDNANPYWFSYPGYSEILTGQVDTLVNSNEYMPNPNTNFFEYINKLPYYHNKVIAFGAWDAFKRILNEKRSGFPVVNGNHIDNFLLKDSSFKFISKLMKDSYQPFGEEALDGYIKHMSILYLKKYKPNAMYVSFGDTDELAHAGNYPEYIKAANRFDEYLASIYDFINSDPAYKNNTIILITTDHGRGDLIKTQWTSHGQKVSDAYQIWYAILGPGVSALGEVKQSEQVYQKDLIHLVANLAGIKFVSEKK